MKTIQVGTEAQSTKGTNEEKTTKRPCSAKALRGGESPRRVGGVTLSALCLCAFATLCLSSYDFYYNLRGE